MRTIAERFRDRGYHTAGLSRNAFASSAVGLNRGFDRFELLSPRSLLRVAGPVTVAKYLLDIRRHSVGLEPNLRRHATGYLMTAVAEDWIESLATNEDPSFLYLHYNEPHRPYCPPLPYRRAFAEDIELSAGEAAAIATGVHDDLMETIATNCELSETEWEALIVMYDAGIAHTNACIGRLFEAVRRSSLGETLFVVTSDHGELFGEQGILGHKYTTDDGIINVPLVTHGTEGSAGGPVQHTDMMATLLRIAGADETGVQGIDFRHEQREYAIAQDNKNTLDSLLEHDPDFGGSELAIEDHSVLRRDGFKLKKSATTRALYRLPDEVTDVAEQYPEIADDSTERSRNGLRRRDDRSMRMGLTRTGPTRPSSATRCASSWPTSAISTRRSRTDSDASKRIVVRSPRSEKPIRPHHTPTLDRRNERLVVESRTGAARRTKNTIIYLG
jgi:uncharacterized sulfatase